MESPAYAALSVCVPSARELVVNVAPPAADSGATPSTAAPSIRVMLPVGTPLVALATFALSVTGTPTLGLLVRFANVASDCAFAMFRSAGVTATA